MPGFDGTGPMGQGSRTGRGLGRCNPANDTGEKNTMGYQVPMGGGFGRGFGRGSGGRGYRRNWNVGTVNDGEKGNT